MSERERLHGRAHSRISNARKRGAIRDDAPCLACGAEQRTMRNGRRRVIQHHPDYARPDYTIPICVSCHGKIHAGAMPEPITGRIYNQPGDNSRRDTIIANEATRRDALAVLPALVERLGPQIVGFAIGVKPETLAAPEKRLRDIQIADSVMRLAESNATTAAQAFRVAQPWRGRVPDFESWCRRYPVA